ncbi:hypothetical protein CHLRE_08g368200v5 [Chlamydomonas reinhardtii]|uniref:Uncharacterized protein n=1 Tax=Chlamydomonas reinhardtii TaxID=3055 RepID=A0A2K3DH18_CHLRE|nr:uncharacterized protein CHLRE_08g368200v5 [Chlamydomonas reinhardtii]PNW79825.1 hypothetical protein CHLRE_08g368200v5 [Chlamydomonas reinhardtii]
MRSAWPLAEVPHSPTIAGIPRHHAVPRFRGLPQPPSPTRLVQSSNQAGPSPLRDRDVATPASSYTSRPSAADTRREDEEHGATQLILLLTLSVVLLTLPWVVDHPVTLLVPVALLILPITSGALRSILSEGASLVFGGMRWFWRHRKTAAPQQQQQAQHQAHQQQHKGAGFGGLPGMHPSSGAHGHGVQPNGATGWPHHLSGGPCAYGAPHHHSPALQSHMPHQHHQHQPHPQQQQQHPAMRSGDHHARPAAPMPPSPGRQQQQQAWQALAPSTHQHHHAAPHPTQAWQPAAAVSHVAAVPHASHSDLTTPDLDFESDHEADAGATAFATQAGSRGTPAHGAMQYAGHCASAMHHPLHQPAAYASHAVHPPPPQPVQQQQQPQQQPQQQRPRPIAGVVDPQAECHIHNWDEPECTGRRGHRPLSELMSNGQ